jgi:hypothetical protein
MDRGGTTPLFLHATKHPPTQPTKSHTRSARNVTMSEGEGTDHTEVTEE